MSGHGWSAHQRAAFAATMQGRPLSLEHRAAIARGSVGKTGHTSERQRAAMRGNHFRRDAPIVGECSYCGAPAREQDHVVPGELDTVPACLNCNSSKNSRDPLQWLADGLYGSHPGKPGRSSQLSELLKGLGR